MFLIKDELAKYLIVDSTEIHKQLYKVKREAAFNDFFNVYTPDDVVAAKEFFYKYNVPEEFQKIIVKINIPFFIKYKAEEYTMGFSFDIAKSKIEKENNNKQISVFSYPVLYNGEVFLDKIKFKTQLEYSRFNEVIDLLAQIDDSGCLQSYLKAIKDFFDISIDLDYLYEVWNEEKDAQKALKVYRKKYPRK